MGQIQRAPFVPIVVELDTPLVDWSRPVEPRHPIQSNTTQHLEVVSIVPFYGVHAYALEWLLLGRHPQIDQRLKRRDVLVGATVHLRSTGSRHEADWTYKWMLMGPTLYYRRYLQETLAELRSKMLVLYITRRVHVKNHGATRCLEIPCFLFVQRKEFDYGYQRMLVKDPTPTIVVLQTFPLPLERHELDP